MPKEAEPIKIALVGTSCVGKTTLLDQFRQKFADNQSIGFVEEAARSFFESHTINKRFSAETQGQIQAIALADEQLAHCGGHGAILCDRSVIDAVVYVRAAEGGKIKRDQKVY